MHVFTYMERQAEAAAVTRDRALAGRPALRRQRGVVHTPPAVARFVAQAADTLLREELGRAGLADPHVIAVDPACGPGAFLAAALAVASDAGGAPGLLLGLDVDAGAIASARRIFGRSSGGRVSLQTRDTLARASPFGRAHLDARSVVVIGNPPWAGRSAHRGDAVSERMLEDFRRDGGGARLEERKLGVLSDEYVRFVRWAAEVARRAPGGAVVALVTNASFLDGPVHRGMRAALARWFDRIDLVDLGGGSLVARAGGTDENVFAVRPSVVVTLAVRHARGAEVRTARVRIARVRGTAAEKLERLADARLGDLAWRSVRVTAPAFRLVPARATVARERVWARWPSLSELMPFHREGVQTNRDALAIDEDRDTLVRRLERFARHGELPRQSEVGLAFDADRARRAVQLALEGARGPDALVRRLDYRPLDARWVAPISHFCHRPRPALLLAMDHSRFALVSVRKDRGERAWSHFGIVRHAVDGCWLSVASSCRTRAWPTSAPDGSANVGLAASVRIAAITGVKPSAADLARYVAAWLASQSYRAHFDGLLRIEPPRVPWPRTAEVWRAMVSAGARLVHAFVGEAPSKRLRLVIEGSPVVSRVRANGSDGVVEIGREGRIRGVPREALELEIGHVPVVAAWLARRAGRVIDGVELAAVVGRARAISRAMTAADAIVTAELDGIHI